MDVQSNTNMQKNDYNGETEKSDACTRCPWKQWVANHRMLVILCLGVIGVFLVIKCITPATVQMVGNQPAKDSRGSSRNMVMDNHGLALFQIMVVGHEQLNTNQPEDAASHI